MHSSSCFIVREYLCPTQIREICDSRELKGYWFLHVVSESRLLQLTGRGSHPHNASFSLDPNLWLFYDISLIVTTQVAVNHCKRNGVLCTKLHVTLYEWNGLISQSLVVDVSWRLYYYYTEGVARGRPDLRFKSAYTLCPNCTQVWLDANYTNKEHVVWSLASGR